MRCFKTDNAKSFNQRIMRLLYDTPFFQTVKSKVIISLFETVRLSVSISPRNLYNSLKRIQEKVFLSFMQRQHYVKTTSHQCNAMHWRSRNPVLASCLWTSVMSLTRLTKSFQHQKYGALFDISCSYTSSPKTRVVHSQMEKLSWS